jgi:hypothetical protein
MCGAPERMTAFGARTFLVYHNNNASESTVDKSVELFEFFRRSRTK